MAQQTINTPRDTTLQATNTALGLLGKDASLQEIKTALLSIVSALSAVTDYDDLTDKPQINSIELAGNKSLADLGIKNITDYTEQLYNQLPAATKMDANNYFCITDDTLTGVPLDDTAVSNGKVWSSQKVNNIVNTLAANVADNYDENETYNIGDWCVHDKALKKCNADNVTGLWDGSKWDDDQIMNEVSLLNSALTIYQDTLTVPSYVTQYVNRLYKRGNLVDLEFTGTLTSPQAGTGTLIATVPSGFIPPERIQIPLYITYGNTPIYSIASLQTSGRIEIALGGSQVSGNVHIHTSYKI